MDVGNESLSLTQAIRVFTQYGSESVMRDDSEGTLAVGKLANLIVLDRNLFDLSPAEISGARVLKTFFRGELVFESENELK